MGTLEYLLSGLFFFLFTHSFIRAQTAQVEQSFIFTDEFNNTQEIIVGYDPFGSEGFDPDLGEENIPQVPPDNFGVRCILPTDSNITLTKDIRFGCYWAIGYDHLIDLNYAPNSLNIIIDWEWPPQPNLSLMGVIFIDPYTGNTIGSYGWDSDSSFFQIPALLNKIIMRTSYDGTLSVEEYEVISPNGGENIEYGNVYTITWSSFVLVPGITIEFSSDAGLNWEYIIENVWLTGEEYEWTIPDLNSSECLIRLGDYPCTYDVSDSFFTITTPVSVEEDQSIPIDFSLRQNYPNPFNPVTKIRFTISDLRFTTLKVYDALGNEVATLVNEEKPAGNYEVEFSAKGGSASGGDTYNLSSGIYFYKLKAGSFVESKKMILLK